MEKLITNLGGLTRWDKMDGKEYLVAPMVMMVEGVLNGSMGPLYYPKEEITKTPVVWNHKPLVVYHPSENGSGVSACSPAVIEKQGIGIIMNTEYDSQNKGIVRLKSEAWIDADKANKIDKRIVSNLEAGKMMELSTGLFTDNEAKEGDFNGKKYVAIARNYRPDHLAILPDQVGACSIKDGAGLLRNKENDNPTRKETGIMTTKERLIASLISNSNSMWGEEDKEFLSAQSESRLKGFLANARSEGGKGGGSVAKDDSVETQQVAQKKIQDDANTGETGDDEEDEATMIDLKPSKRGKIKGPMANAGKSEHSDDEEDEVDEDESMEDESEGGKKGGAKKAATTNKAAKKPAPVTVESFLASAPEPIRNLLSNALMVENQQKKALVAKICENHANTFTEEFLMGKDMEELNALAQLATSGSEHRFARNTAAPVQNFAGQGEPIRNTGGKADFVPLSAPSMDFSTAE